MPKVARHLQQTIGWDPVLWISYSYQKEAFKEVFPETPWQDLEDAFVGIPIPGVNSAQPPTLDADLLLRLQAYLPRLMNQMNRFGPPDVFLYDERESFARNLLFQWHEALVVTEPDVVFFEEPPNGPFTYALYVLCRELRIPTVYLSSTTFPTLALLQEAIEQLPLRLEDALNGESSIASRDLLPGKVRQAIGALTESPEFSHWYMREQAEFDARAAAIPEPPPPPPPAAIRVRGLAIKALHSLNVLKWPLFVRNYLDYRALCRRQQMRPLQPAESLRRKFPGIPMGVRRCTIGELEQYQARAREIKEHLRADYLRRCEEPDTADGPYVYFPLHYRPERTSNPDGGVFYDQIIPLAMISEVLPPGWKIYVKEHPTQFSMMLEGECGRTPQYYDEIAALRGVKFIAPEVSSKALLMGSEVAATITGTIGLEAALNHKPAMYFGYPWYQGCPGTTRVSSAQEVADLFATLSDRIPTDSQLDTYFDELVRASFNYAQTAWVMNPPPATPDEQVLGLVEALTWWHKNRYLASRTISRDSEPECAEA